MKNIALIAAAGSLAAITVPANAAELPAPIQSELTSDFSMVSPLAVMFDSDKLALASDRDRRKNRNRARGNRGRYYDHGRYEDRGRYDDRGRYYEPRRISRNDRVWRDRDGRYRCERDNGTTGLVIGAGLGALAGRTVDTDGDRTVGTLLGALAGGLLGREIDRGSLNCR